MRVLLISANRLTSPYPVYPIGLDYVRRAVGQRHEAAVLDAALPRAPERLAAEIARFEPQLLGIALRNIDSTGGSNGVSALEGYRALVRQVRAHTAAPIVLGGSGFTIAPRQYLAALGADYGIVGEGERLAALADALEAGAGGVRDLPGVVAAAGTGEVIMPEPWRGSFERSFDESCDHVGYYLRRGGMLNLQTKRGCPYRCVYCTYPWIEGRRLRLFEPAEVARTALALQEAGAAFIFVTDASFNVRQEHTIAVAQALRAAGVTVPWGGFFAPLTTSPDYFRALAECGLSHVEFGTESLSRRVLQGLQKPFSPETALASHEAALAAGLKVAHYLMFGGPGETEETVAETCGRAAKLRECVCFFYTGVRIFPHTPLYDLARQEGQLTAEPDPLEPVFYQPAGLPLARLDELVERATAGRPSWIAGSKLQKTAAILERLYARGHVGPLWERLIG